MAYSLARASATSANDFRLMAGAAKSRPHGRKGVENAVHWPFFESLRLSEFSSHDLSYLAWAMASRRAWRL